MQIQCITIQCSESVRYNALEYNANTVQCSLSRGTQYNPNTMQQGNEIQCITILYNTILQRTQCSLGGQEGNAGLIYEWSATARRPSKLYYFSSLCFLLPHLPLLYHHFVIIFVADFNVRLAKPA